jgi:hypothetical protein
MPGPAKGGAQARADIGPGQSKEMSMSDDQPFREGSIRKLWPTDTGLFREHLLRLDKESRRLRFAHSVSDAFIEEYASRMGDFGSMVFAYFLAGRVRGAAELRRLGDVWGLRRRPRFPWSVCTRTTASARSLWGGLSAPPATAASVVSI